MTKHKNIETQYGFYNSESRDTTRFLSKYKIASISASAINTIPPAGTGVLKVIRIELVPFLIKLNASLVESSSEGVSVNRKKQ